jgi:hypothetical protein
MDQLMRDHLAATFFEDYQGLRSELITQLSDLDLAFRVGPGTLTLGELCRDIGDVEQSYIDSFRTFRQDFKYRNHDPALTSSVAALTFWLAQLDGDLAQALDTLTADDITGRHIERDPEFRPLPRQQLDIYREALLIFYAKVSIYLRAMGRQLSPLWLDWIG